VRSCRNLWERIRCVSEWGGLWTEKMVEIRREISPFAKETVKSLAREAENMENVDEIRKLLE